MWTVTVMLQLPKHVKNEVMTRLLRDAVSTTCQTNALIILVLKVEARFRLAIRDVNSICFFVGCIYVEVSKACRRPVYHMFSEV